MPHYIGKRALQAMITTRAADLERARYDIAHFEEYMARRMRGRERSPEVDKIEGCCLSMQEYQLEIEINLLEQILRQYYQKRITRARKPPEMEECPACGTWIPPDLVLRRVVEEIPLSPQCPFCEEYL